MSRPGALSRFLHATLVSAICGGEARADEAHSVVVDFAVAAGTLRPLHGINKGPLAANGLIEVTAAQQRLHIPFTRLHDCQHPNPAVVDIHAVFPNPEADPAGPESFDFRATDEYIAAVRATGAEVIYRLGESIEHQSVKRHVHPPRDFERWAAVCAGVVRHYNEGWANGHHYGIRYWEIWNEPENRPAMWTGDDSAFLRLYAVTSRALRAEFPSIRIGGPGFGSCGRFDGSEIAPSEFCAAFLDACRDGPLPLDFFSWHHYTNNPSELIAMARAIRRMLDGRGFTKCESHLNEWNYLPGNSWDVLSRMASPESRQRAAEEMTGATGAAFLAAALIGLQDAPVDVCNFFHGETGLFGLFTEVGAPARNYGAMLAFATMLETPGRAAVTGTIDGRLAVTGGTDRDKSRAAILISSLNGPETLRISIRGLPWTGDPAVTARVVDRSNSLAPRPDVVLKDGAITCQLVPPAVAILTLGRQSAPPAAPPRGKDLE